MYALKPVLVDQKIELPTCMYKLKPVNASLAENMTDSINNSVSSAWNAIRSEISRCGFSGQFGAGFAGAEAVADP